MKKIKYLIIAALVGAGLAVAAVPQEASAATLNPIMLTQGDYTQTVDGVEFTVRKDLNHPYVEYTNAYGTGYNRQMVVDMTITNHSGKAFNYTAYTTAVDANGAPLVNADSLAAAKFGTLKDGESATVLAVFLLTSKNNVNTFTMGYQHMDYSAQYLADMNAYLAGTMTAAEVAIKYPQTPVIFTVNYPFQQPGVGGADARSAVKGSITTSVIRSSASGSSNAVG